MFSSQKKSSHSFFSPRSASADRVVQADLITFLSVVQKSNIYFLPISWQPALGILGEGGTGAISQSALSLAMTLAFKRFHSSGDLEDPFLPLITEVSILSQAPIQEHPNIINLEGVCWEVKPGTEEVLPVLVFEKATWDLHQFMKVEEGMKMTIYDKLKVCTDIGAAIMALHTYGRVF